MKKVLVLAGVLCLMASVSRAAILEGWLTSDNMNPPADATFNVTIWLEVVDDARIIPPEDLSHAGIQNATVSIYQQNPPGNCAPVPKGSGGYSTLVKTLWNFDAFDGDTYIPAQRQDGNGDGYLDAL